MGQDLGWRFFFGGRGRMAGGKIGLYNSHPGYVPNKGVLIMAA